MDRLTMRAEERFNRRRLILLYMMEVGEPFYTIGGRPFSMNDVMNLAIEAKALARRLRSA